MPAFPVQHVRPGKFAVLPGHVLLVFLNVPVLPAGSQMAVEAFVRQVIVLQGLRVRRANACVRLIVPERFVAMMAVGELAGLPVLHQNRVILASVSTVNLFVLRGFADRMLAGMRMDAILVRPPMRV